MRREDSRRQVHIDGVLAIKETELALLCVIDEEEHWIPKSQITDDSEVYKNGDEGELVITLWFAEREGLA